MSKMKDLYIEIEEALMQEMPVEKISETFGVPVAWVLEVKYEMIAAAESYIASV
jgi:hypothetical protein